MGDSQLKRIDGNKLSSESRNVQVTAVGGMRIEQLKNHVEHDKWDNIVVHVGTNNLKEGNPTKITDKLDQCLTFIQARNPNCQVAFSGIFSRKDNPDLNRNGHVVNEKINPITYGILPFRQLRGGGFLARIQKTRLQLTD